MVVMVALAGFWTNWQDLVRHVGRLCRCLHDRGHEGGGHLSHRLSLYEVCAAFIAVEFPLVCGSMAVSPEALCLAAFRASGDLIEIFTVPTDRTGPDWSASEGGASEVLAWLDYGFAFLAWNGYDRRVDLAAVRSLSGLLGL
jgi:hypothetical protein